MRGTLDHVNEMIDAGFNGLGLPAYMKDGVRLYVFEGLRPGGFMSALLENNLSESYCRADENNIRCIENWVKFLRWNIPGGCWGSREVVSEWKGLNNMDVK